MSARQSLGRGGFAAAACVACCAAPIVGALGVTAGLAAMAALFVGLAAAVAVVLLGAGWIETRVRRRPSTDMHELVAVAAPTKRVDP